MIVVAIIGILAAVALPAYQDYTVRAKVSEIILAASTCRTAVTEAVQTGGSLPAGGAYGCESSGAGPVSKYVQSVATGASGTITVTATSDPSLKGAASANVTLTPTIASGNVTGWTCNGSIPAKYLPSSCRG